MYGYDENTEPPPAGQDESKSGNKAEPVTLVEFAAARTPHSPQRPGPIGVKSWPQGGGGSGGGSIMFATNGQGQQTDDKHVHWPVVRQTEQSLLESRQKLPTSSRRRRRQQHKQRRRHPLPRLASANATTSSANNSYPNRLPEYSLVQKENFAERRADLMMMMMMRRNQRISGNRTMQARAQTKDVSDDDEEEEEGEEEEQTETKTALGDDNGQLRRALDYDLGVLDSLVGKTMGDYYAGMNIIGDVAANQKRRKRRRRRRRRRRRAPVV